MKKMKLLHSITAAVLLCSLLLCATGCGKKPVQTEPTDQQTSATDSTEKNPTQATQPKPTSPAPTEETKVTVPTTATEASDPTETTAPPCDHIPGNWIVSATSTCTTEGSRYKQCTVCSATVITESIPKISHAPGNWRVDKAATCTEEGKQHQICTQCDTRLITITVAKNAHQEVTVSGYDATSTRNGLTDGKKCTDCNTVTQPQYVIPAANYSGFCYAVNSDDRTTCTVIYMGTDSDITVPDAIAGYTVTGLGDNAFANQETITKIVLSGYIKSIGSNAFAGCSALTDITYNGDRATWNSLPKGAGWNTNTGNYKINCINGIISK